MRKFLISAAAICLIASAAHAGPTEMTDRQMDKVVAGETIDNPAGVAVFTYDATCPLCWTNNGGYQFADGQGPAAKGGVGGILFGNGGSGGSG